MDETYRMLGREHQADLEREAQGRRLAAHAAKAPKTDAAPRTARRRRLLVFRARPKEA
jgi:hypothetical protein